MTEFTQENTMLSHLQLLAKGQTSLWDQSKPLSVENRLQEDRIVQLEKSYVAAAAP